MDIDIKIVFDVMLELFSIMVLGFIVTKMKYLDKKAGDKFSWLVVNISLPLLIISSVLGKEGDIKEVFVYLIAGFIFYIASIIVAYVFCKILFVKKKNMGTYQFMLIFSNCSFMGYPVISAVMGPEAMFYMSIFNMPFNVFAFSYGIYMLSKSGDGEGTFKLSKLINPGIIASIFAIIIYGMGIKFPTFVENTCSTLGGITTPLSMIILGISLAQIQIKDLFIEFRIYPMTAIRLIILPVITVMVVKFFSTDPMLIAVATCTAGMPVASLGVMLSALYGGNVKLASLGVFLTTTLSVVTIPLVLKFLL